MRLNEGIIQISSQILAKGPQEMLILVLVLIFIEITRGPLTFRLNLLKIVIEIMFRGRNVLTIKILEKNKIPTP